MTRVRTLFAEALRSIGANVSTTVASALSVLIGMFLIGVFIGLGTWLVSWSDDKKRELAVHVFIADQATTRQVDELRVLLESDKRVKPAAGSRSSRRQTRSRSCASAIPSSPRTSPRTRCRRPSTSCPCEARTPRRSPSTCRRRGSRAVDEVRYGKEVSQRILAIARAIQIVFLIAVFVLLAASTILIANTIRLSVHARRREIEVMKLVGASNWYVRGPFMLEGLLTGLAGSIAAVSAPVHQPRDRDPADPRAHPGRRRREGDGVHVDGADPDHGRPRHRSARLGPDAPPLSPRLIDSCRSPASASVVGRKAR